MKKHQKPILISLIFSILQVTGTLQAALVTAPASGDLFLGIRASGGTGSGKSYIVNIGNDATFRNATPGTALNLGNIGADLSATFGANWHSRSDVFWAIFGTRNQPNPVTYSSRTQSPNGTPSAGFSAQTLEARTSSNQQLISVITGYSTLQATANNAKAAIQTNTATAASYNYQVATAGTTDFGNLSGWNTIEGNFANGITGTTLDLFRYSGNTTTGVNTVQRLGELSITNTSGDLSFLAFPNYDVSITTPSNGTVTGLTGGGKYGYGATATLTANPASGYAFTAWTVDGSPAGSANPLVLTVNGNKTVTASFVPVYTVTVSSSANGSVTGLNSGGTYLSGATATLTAVPAPGYALTSWTVNGSPAGNASPLVLTVTANRSIVATFGQDNALTVNGFTGFEEYRVGLLVASLSGLKVGDVVGSGGTFPAIDLSFITLRTTPSVQTLAITGLPPGLRYVPNADKTKGGTIVGIVTGELGPLGVDIKRTSAAFTAGGVTTPASTATFPFNIDVLPFNYAGSYEVLIENAGTPVGKARLTITTLTTPTVGGVAVPTVSYSASLETQGVVTTSGTTTTKTRSKAGSVQNPNTLVSGGRLQFPVTFDAVTTPSASPAVSVTFGISPTSDLVDGSATAGGPAWTLRGFRLAKPGRSWSQRVSVRLASDLAGKNAPTAAPGGTGFAVGSVASTALVSLTGNLGDSQAFATGLNLSQTKQAVVFFQPYADLDSTSSVGGIIDIGDLVKLPRALSWSTERQTTGLKWTKGAQGSDAYTSGFGPLNVTATVGKYNSVPAGQGLADSLGLTNRRVLASYPATGTGTVLTSKLPANKALPSLFSLRNTGSLVRLLPANSIPSALTTAPVAGTFTGAPSALTFDTGSGFYKTTIAGALLQDDLFGTQVGAGYIKVFTNTFSASALPSGPYVTTPIQLDNQ